MPLSLSASDLLPRIRCGTHNPCGGCGDGELAAAYRRMNPKVRMLGIEPDQAAAALAAEHVDQVSSVDIEADPLPFALPDGLIALSMTTSCIARAILGAAAPPCGGAQSGRHAAVPRPERRILAPDRTRLRGTWMEPDTGCG